jgi:cytochrome o ubiquinol oxidase operon protein cyoD
MSSIEHPTSPEPKQPPVKATMYVVGFVMSLVFTLIPYYLVVKKELNKNTLLATIIGFAVTQLIIQVVFFLHLGREKKPRFNLVFLMSTISLILVVVVGSIWIMNHLHYNMMPKDVTDKIVTDEAVYQVSGKQAGTCPGTGTNYKVELKGSTLTPSHVDAHVCDTITIVNMDKSDHAINFGAYGQHETYAGEAGESIRSDHSVVITLTELGTHKFHDHVQGGATGDFTVKP